MLQEMTHPDVSQLKRSARLLKTETGGMGYLPVLSRLPAFGKLKARSFSPGESREFLQQSQAEVGMIEELPGSIV